MLKLRKKTRFYMVLTIMIIASTYLYFENQNCPEILISDRLDVHISDFIARVWPQPDSQLSLYCYLSKHATKYAIGRGIGATLPVVKIDQLLTDPSIGANRPVYQRSFLKVDGRPVSSETFTSLDEGVLLLIQDPSGQVINTGRSTMYDVSWMPLLSPGTHSAEIEVERDTGEVLKFTWTFTITIF